MRFSVLLAAITIAWISVTIDAAAVMKKQSKHLGFRKMSKNIHAMSAEDEHFSACGSRMDMFQVQSVSSNEYLCLGCKTYIDIEGILRVPQGCHSPPPGIEVLFQSDGQDLRSVYTA